MDNEKYNELAKKLIEDAKKNDLPWFSFLFNPEIIDSIRKESQKRKWIKRNDGWFDFFQCPVCYHIEAKESEFCPNCFSEMDLD